MLARTAKAIFDLPYLCVEAQGRLVGGICREDENCFWLFNDHARSREVGVDNS
jgi:hypothetical protein